MIKNLNVFSENTYVVAEEWNANFYVLDRSNEQCSEAINDANETLAFPNKDLSGVYARVRQEPDSFQISGNSVIVSAEKEYYKPLGSGQDLQITIPQGMNGEARIAIYIPDNRSELPFVVNYPGEKVISHYDYVGYNSGYYYIMIYETNNLAMVKIIWTGV